MSDALLRRVVLDLGCGRAKQPGSLGLDRRPLPGVDVVADFEASLPLASDSVDGVYSKSVLEHLDHFESLMEELHRVVKLGGEIHLLVPHFSSPLSFSDFTHRRFFGYYSFDYLTPEAGQNSFRKVPDFYTSFKFRILSKHFRFVSYFRGVRWLWRQWERLVNSSEWWALFYESHLCYLIPCYQIEVRLSPVKPPPR
jgi:ubiquinone/menaquinone biosynthesis C-methylase UbiE